MRLMLVLLFVCIVNYDATVNAMPPMGESPYNEVVLPIVDIGFPKAIAIFIFMPLAYFLAHRRWVRVVLSALLAFAIYWVWDECMLLRNFKPLGISLGLTFVFGFMGYEARKYLSKP